MLTTILLFWTNHARCRWVNENNEEKDFCKNTIWLKKWPKKVRKARQKLRTFKWHCVFVVNNEICCYCWCNLDSPPSRLPNRKFCVNYAKKHTKFLFRMRLHSEYQVTSTHLIRWHSIMCVPHLFLLHISPRNKTFYSLDERKFFPRHPRTGKPECHHTSLRIIIHLHFLPHGSALKLTSIHSLTEKSILFLRLHPYLCWFFQIPNPNKT